MNERLGGARAALHFLRGFGFDVDNESELNDVNVENITAIAMKLVWLNWGMQMKQLLSWGVQMKLLRFCSQLMAAQQ